MIRYAAEHYEPRYSPAKDPQFLLDLPHAACRPRSAPDMRWRMRSPSHAPSFCFGKPVWLPRIPTSCPNTAKAPCVCTLPARSEAWNRPSRARFRPAAAAGAARRGGAPHPRRRRCPAAAAAADATPRGASARPPLYRGAQTKIPCLSSAQDWSNHTRDGPQSAESVIQPIAL